MKRQGTVEALTCIGLDAFLLTQNIYEQLAFADYMRTDYEACLTAIPYMDEALRDLVTFYFIAMCLFSMGKQHAEAFAELLRLI